MELTALEVILMVIAALIVVYELWPERPSTFRTKDGRLHEISSTGALRLRLDDTQTKAVLAEDIKKFHDNFGVNDDGKLFNKKTGQVIELD